MIKVKQTSQCSDDYVYDISLDGTFVNALGMNVVHNTDGFNFKLPDKYRYTDENPYISNGKGRNSVEGKSYTGLDADICEFEDKYMGSAYNGGINKMGLGLDEVVSSTINFSRKNYCDYFPENPYPEDVKMVGNTIKSKKMPEYIAKFLSKALRLLLQGKGKEFIDEYYAYFNKIYNYKIPLKDIASKGKIKKSLDEYIQGTKEVTKSGTTKSRQAWYELAIKHNVKVDNGDTIYYVNTGTSKSHNDIKKVTHYYEYVNGEKVEVTKDIEKQYKEYKKEKSNTLTKLKWIAKFKSNVIKDEEIIFNSILVPKYIISSDRDVFCDEKNGIEYNVAKYVDMFNKRIKPLLVCFSKEIREDILITNPKDIRYFTEEECALVSGEPNKECDQDTYEQLMTMEDKEILFWTKYNLTPPFIEECGMGTWDEIQTDYFKRQEEEKQLGIDIIRSKYDEILHSMTPEQLNDFIEEGKLPKSLTDIITIDVKTNNFVSKEYPDIVIGSISDIVELVYDDVIEAFNRL